jgi:hypothetical protein
MPSSSRGTTPRSSDSKRRCARYAGLKQGFFDKQNEQKPVVAKEPLRQVVRAEEAYPEEEDKENQGHKNRIEDKEEVRISKAPKKALAKKVVKEEEVFNFMPKLSKNSMIIASSLVLERLRRVTRTSGFCPRRKPSAHLEPKRSRSPPLLRRSITNQPTWTTAEETKASIVSRSCTNR